jgi:hypothetical protein
MPAYISNTTQLLAGDGATPTEVFTAVAQVLSVKLPAYERNIVELRTLGNSYPDQLVGPYNTMEAEFKLAFDPDMATHEAMRTRLIAATTHNYRVSLPDGGTPQSYTLRGIFTKFELDEFTAEGAEIVANATLRLTALPTVV